MRTDFGFALLLALSALGFAFAIAGTINRFIGG
jgi:hypothetical protein